jgi:uncharacterized FlaG/YvyC family protein
MAGNTVASLQDFGGAVAAASSTQTTTATERAFNRSVSEAVQTVNESQYLGAGRSVTFSVDQASRLPVVKVVDTSTNEVVDQWPPEYLLQLAADVKNLTRDSG